MILDACMTRIEVWWNKTYTFTQAVKYQPLPPTTSKPHSQENAYYYKVIDAADQTCSNIVVNQSLAVTCVRAARREGAKFRFKPISIFLPFSVPLALVRQSPSFSSIHQQGLIAASFLSSLIKLHPKSTPNAPILRFHPEFPKPHHHSKAFETSTLYHHDVNFNTTKILAVISTARSRLLKNIRRRRKWHSSISFR